MSVSEFSEIKAEPSQVSTFADVQAADVLGDQNSYVELRALDEYPLAARWEDFADSE